jgi:hypothetical protein
MQAKLDKARTFNGDTHIQINSQAKQIIVLELEIQQTKTCLADKENVNIRLNSFKWQTEKDLKHMPSLFVIVGLNI